MTTSEPTTIDVTAWNGDVISIPFAQASSMADCIEALVFTGKAAAWHINACGCCIAVHEDVEHPSQGFVVGRDGGVSFVEITPVEDDDHGDDSYRWEPEEGEG